MLLCWSRLFNPNCLVVSMCVCVCMTLEHSMMCIGTMCVYIYFIYIYIYTWNTHGTLPKRHVNKTIHHPRTSATRIIPTSLRRPWCSILTLTICRNCHSKDPAPLKTTTRRTNGYEISGIFINMIFNDMTIWYKSHSASKLSNINSCQRSCWTCRIK